MDVDNLKEMAGKFFKGCGCLTVGFFILVTSRSKVIPIRNWMISLAWVA